MNNYKFHYIKIQSIYINDYDTLSIEIRGVNDSTGYSFPAFRYMGTQEKQSVFQMKLLEDFLGFEIVNKDNITGQYYSLLSNMSALLYNPLNHKIYCPELSFFPSKKLIESREKIDLNKQNEDLKNLILECNKNKDEYHELLLYYLTQTEDSDIKSDLIKQVSSKVLYKTLNENISNEDIKRNNKIKI